MSFNFENVKVKQLEDKINLKSTAIMMVKTIFQELHQKLFPTVKMKL